MLPVAQIPSFFSSPLVPRGGLSLPSKGGERATEQLKVRPHVVSVGRYKVLGAPLRSLGTKGGMILPGPDLPKLTS